LPRFSLKSTVLAGALILAAPASTLAADPVGPKLTPKLLDLLRQEMAQVLAASQDILAAMVAGDHAAVAERAQQIHDSFILQQSLTEQDREDLMAAVPPEFVELDRAFHQMSGELAGAGRAEDAKREVATFNQMTDACVACHSRFAADRFPGLAQE